MKTKLLAAAVSTLLFASPAYAWNPYHDYMLYDLTYNQEETSPLTMSFCSYKPWLSYSLQTLCNSAQWYVDTLDSCETDFKTVADAYTECKSDAGVIAEAYMQCDADRVLAINTINAAKVTLAKSSKLIRKLRKACGTKCNGVR